MDYLKIAALTVSAALLALVIRRVRPELGMTLALSSGALVLLLALPTLAQLISGLSAMARTGGVSNQYMAQLLKVAGVSLLMDFAAQTCRDAGEDGLAQKAELAGRVMLLSLALPSMQTLLTQILSLSPERSCCSCPARRWRSPSRTASGRLFRGWTPPPWRMRCGRAIPSRQRAASGPR